MRITTQLPNTGFERAGAEEMRSLRAIVIGAHPWLRDHDEQAFARSFTAIGFMFRTPAPVTSRYFDGVVSDVNALLDEVLGLLPVDGVATMAAILAHGDICWREGNARLGQMLEVGTNSYHGRRCANAWRDVLKGRPLLAPTPPPERLTRPVGMPQVQFFQAGNEQAFWR